MTSESRRNAITMGRLCIVFDGSLGRSRRRRWPGNRGARASRFGVGILPSLG